MAARVTALMDIVVRTNQAHSAALPAIRQKIAEIDQQLGLANIRTMDEWVSNSTAQPRMNTVLLFIFSSIALVIASIGIYGVLAYSVSQRTSEIGLRMALGASRGDIFRLVATEGVRLALTGLGVGLVTAVFAGKAISSLIYGVSVRDPATYALVAGLLLIVSLAACILPGLRTARLVPILALRNE